MDAPPRAPTDRTPGQLGFEPRSMVSWYCPSMLVRAARYARSAKEIGRYADRREMQAALTAVMRDPVGGPRVVDAADAKGAVVGRWFDVSSDADGAPRQTPFGVDYVADTADGFDPTYTMARLLSSAQLEVATKEGVGATERGVLLVLGGDQVYPFADRTEYRDRFVGPFRSALPHVVDPTAAPTVLATPGNHDWDDGLSSFLRLFCQGRWIGGWRTIQDRSYYAVKLTERLWLWGLDIHVLNDVDLPQRAYFEAIAKHAMAEGSSVVLVVATPSWTEPQLEASEGYRNLRFVERKLIAAHGHRTAIVLAGDSHHFARHRRVDAPGLDPEGELARSLPEHYVVSGGGGGYTWPTGGVRERVDLPEEGQRPDATHYRRVDESLYPSACDSRGMAARTLLFALWNPAFALLLGVLALLHFWNVQASPEMAARFAREAPSGTGLLHAVSTYAAELPDHALALVVGILVIGGCLLLADARSLLARIALGGLHAVVQLAALWVVPWFLRHHGVGDAVASWLADGPAPLTAIESLRLGWLFEAALVVVATGAVLATIFGLYLCLAYLVLRRHTEHVASAQRSTRHKSFLRLRIDPAGTLTLHAIGVDRVPGSWRLRWKPAVGEPWFDPSHDTFESIARAHRIEEPVVVRFPP